MKVAVIGSGGVGSACLMSLIQRVSLSEIVVIDKDNKRASAVTTDMQYGASLSSPIHIYAGDYSDLTDFAVVMITAGVNEKTGGATHRDDPNGRLKLLSTNASIYRDIVPKIVAVAPNAVILVITDPPDPLAFIARQLAGHDRVISAGTYLDSLRFRFHLAKAFGVSPMDVQAQVLGEHGTSEVFVWSSANIAGIPLQTLMDKHGLSKQQIEQQVKFANITIIEGNNASQYGIGMASARLTEAILRNEQAVFPVGSYHEKYGTTLSLPSVVGEKGVMRVFEPILSKEESNALQQSANKLKEAVKTIDLA